MRHWSERFYQMLDDRDEEDDAEIVHSPTRTVPPLKSLSSARPRPATKELAATTTGRNKQLRELGTRYEARGAQTEHGIMRAIQMLSASVLGDLCALGHGERVGLTETNDNVEQQATAAIEVTTRVPLLIALVEQQCLAQDDTLQHEFSRLRATAVLGALRVIQMAQMTLAKEREARQVFIEKINRAMIDNFVLHFSPAQFGVNGTDESQCPVCTTDYDGKQCVALRPNCCQRKSSICEACYARHAYQSSQCGQTPTFTCPFCRHEEPLYPPPVLVKRKRKP